VSVASHYSPPQLSEKAAYSTSVSERTNERLLLPRWPGEAIDMVRHLREASCMFRREPVVETRDVERRSLVNAPTLSGVPVRDEDIERAKGLHSIARLFRALAGMLVVLTGVQIFNGITGAVATSVSGIITDAIQLLLVAGLMWGAGDLADLFVKSHYDLRATRILLGRLTRRIEERPVTGVPVAPGAPLRRRSTDIMH
jgi:hypothetical protein